MAINRLRRRNAILYAKDIFTILKHNIKNMLLSSLGQIKLLRAALRPDTRWLPMSVLVYPVVIFRKLSNADPQLLQNTIRKLPSLILLMHASPRCSPGEIFGVQKICANINTGSCLTWRQTTDQARFTASLVNYCKPSATLRTCCSQSSSVVSMTLKLNRRRAMHFYAHCEILV